MCGITGVVQYKNNQKNYLDRIESANNCLRHRGPDGGAVFKDERVALGHRRLSIIDTSTAADQPMYSADGRYVIVFNGEIFNFRELKARYLPTQPFKTTSDTEVFLYLFAQYGAACFEWLRGFFAAAIYDRRESSVWVVRDPFGKKPIHVYEDADGLLFASELKSLLTFGIPKELDLNVLPVYLQLNYIPQPLSMIKGVRKLMPGRYLKIDADGCTEHSYYELRVDVARYDALNYQQAKEKIVEVMDEATRVRLIADVPLGCFLSGGVDSSVVVALAARHSSDLKTFSIGYKDNPFFDETKYAALVAKKYKTNHTVFSLSNADFLEHIDSVLDSIDEPFADSSAIPEYILCHYTRKHVTVALSGDGGDEVFAGYNKHGAEWKMRNLDWKGRAVIAADPLWKVLPKSRSNPASNLFRQLAKFSSAGKLTQADRYWRLASLAGPEAAQSLLSSRVRQQLSRDYAGEIREEMTRMIGTDFNDFLKADMRLVLLGDMLVKVDLMSMANSLEVRSPFIDKEVVDFAFGLPASYKVSGKMKKMIVQDAFRDLLPEEIYNRPKHGFEIPLREWLTREFWSLIDNDLLETSFVKEQGIFDVAAVTAIKQKLRSVNPGDSHATIWALLVFQYWWKRYLA